MNVAEAKKSLRKEMLLNRSLLEKSTWEVNSYTIYEHILQSEEYQLANTIHCYISMNERFEVDTMKLLLKILEDKKKLVVPISDFQNNTLDHSYLYDCENLSSNKWGVLEPRSKVEANISDVDLVIVPLLAADKKGNRLGYGKGFYDRFLSEISIPTFGLIFNDFILETIPCEKFDIPLNGLVSESGFIYV